MRRPSPLPLVAALIVGLPACTDGASDGEAGARDSLTREQKDSVIAESGLPGARGVGRARELSEEARERADRLDSLDAP